MTILLWILGIAVLLYLLLVFPAGVAVYINKRNYKNSPYKGSIDKIIQDYKEDLVTKDKIYFDNLVKNRQNEIIEKDGVQYSIEYSARRNKNKYTIIISVGRLRPITIGHTEKFEITL